MAESVIHVTVKPKSPKNSVTFGPDGLVVRVSAPPVDGAANAAVVETLAKALGVPKSRLEITAGATGRRKRVRVAGLTPDELAERIGLLRAES